MKKCSSSACLAQTRYDGVMPRHCMLGGMAFCCMQLMGAMATTGAEGRKAMQPLECLLSSREALWRDLRCLDVAAKLSSLLSGPDPRAAHCIQKHY